MATDRISRSDPSPSEFFTAFQSVVREHESALLERAHQNREYTDFMLRQVMPRIALNLGMCCFERDYYTLDCILYHEKDEIHFDPIVPTYAKYISVAIEHENNYLGTAAEMNKLQLFNAPLKVLITYPTVRREAETLERYSAIIQGSDVFNDVSTLRRQSVIFGYVTNARAEWKGFVYQDLKFVLLESQAQAAVSQSAPT